MRILLCEEVLTVSPSQDDKKFLRAREKAWMKLLWFSRVFHYKGAGISFECYWNAEWRDFKALNARLDTPRNARELVHSHLNSSNYSWKLQLFSSSSIVRQFVFPLGPLPDSHRCRFAVTRELSVQIRNNYQSISSFMENIPSMFVMWWWWWWVSLLPSQPRSQLWRSSFIDFLISLNKNTNQTFIYHFDAQHHSLFIRRALCCALLHSLYKRFKSIENIRNEGNYFIIYFRCLNANGLKGDCVKPFGSDSGVEGRQNNNVLLAQ